MPKSPSLILIFCGDENIGGFHVLMKNLALIGSA
jgi:hypothetical protein